MAEHWLFHTYKWSYGPLYLSLVTGPALYIGCKGFEQWKNIWFGSIAPLKINEWKCQWDWRLQLPKWLGHEQGFLQIGLGTSKTCTKKTLQGGPQTKIKWRDNGAPISTVSYNPSYQIIRPFIRIITPFIISMAFINFIRIIIPFIWGPPMPTLYLLLVVFFGPPSYICLQWAINPYS